MFTGKSGSGFSAEASGNEAMRSRLLRDPLPER